MKKKSVDEKTINEQLKQAKEDIIEELNERPPTIGIIGASGTGKSSTINTLFRTDLPISHVVACTKDFLTIPLSTTVQEGQAKGQKVSLNIVDAPGLGESISKDPQYLEMYQQNLGHCDVILWVTTARNRAIALDQMYLQKLSGFHEKMVFGINQVDLIEPINWIDKTGLPSQDQEDNIKTIIKDRKEKLESVLKRNINIVPFSAKRSYKLQELFTALIEVCPDDRAWIFSAIKGFRFDEFLPETIRKEIVDLADEQQRKNVKTKTKKETLFPFLSSCFNFMKNR